MAASRVGKTQDRLLYTAGLTRNTRARAVPAAVKTSAGVWTPRYIREKGTRIIKMPHRIRTQVRLAHRPRTPKVPTEFCV